MGYLTPKYHLSAGSRFLALDAFPWPLLRKRPQRDDSVMDPVEKRICAGMHSLQICVLACAGATMHTRSKRM
eukprot:259805-Pelagomonas_calceolata.AAC.5